MNLNHLNLDNLIVRVLLMIVNSKNKHKKYYEKNCFDCRLIGN